MPRGKKAEKPEVVEPVNTEEMTDAEIAAFNEQEAARRQKMLDQQQENRAGANKAVPERDESIIRGIKGPDLIRCVTVRKIGLDVPDICTSDVDETVDLPRVVAKRLQDSGAVKIEL